MSCWIKRTLQRNSHNIDFGIFGNIIGKRGALYVGVAYFYLCHFSFCSAFYVRMETLFLQMLPSLDDNFGIITFSYSSFRGLNLNFCNTRSSPSPHIIISDGRIMRVVFWYMIYACVHVSVHSQFLIKKIPFACYPTFGPLSIGLIVNNFCVFYASVSPSPNLSIFEFWPIALSTAQTCSFLAWFFCCRLFSPHWTLPITCTTVTIFQDGQAEEASQILCFYFFLLPFSQMFYLAYNRI